MTFLKKNYILILILLLSIYLRANYDFFIKGYNYDELAIMSVANQDFPFGIIKTMANIDYHAPLYYFICHIFAGLENEWLYLRILNLFFSITNILVFYKIGTLLKDKKTGYILALILAVNHLEISTVSFVKFYCMCFLLFSVNLYYLIKIFKKDEGYIKFAITNLFFIQSATLGIMAIFCEYLGILIFKRNKKIIKSILISLVGFILYLPILLKQIYLNYITPISPHASYSEFSYLAFYNLLNDYFSPLINYCCNLPTVQASGYFINFVSSILKNEFDYISLLIFIIFSFIPVVLSIVMVLYAIKNNKVIRNINIVNFIYLAFFITLTLLEKTGFIPIYMYPSGLILLISLGYGISILKNKKIFFTVFSILIFLQLFISNTYALDKRGFMNAKIYYCYEKYFSEHNSTNTHYIGTEGGRFLKKYYRNISFFDFDFEKMNGVFTREYLKYLYGEEIANKINKKNIKSLTQEIIFKNIRNKDFEKFFLESVDKKIKKGDKIVLSFISGENPFLYKKEEYREYLFNKNYRPHLAEATVSGVLKRNKRICCNRYTELLADYAYKYLIDIMDKYYKRIRVEQYTRTIDDNYIKIFDSSIFQKSTTWIGENTINGWIFVTYEKQ